MERRCTSNFLIPCLAKIEVHFETATRRLKKRQESGWDIEGSNIEQRK